MKASRKDLIRSLLEAPPGNVAAWLDLLRLELEEGRLEMETATDVVDMWRAQGRIQEIRKLMNALKIKES